MVGLYQMRKNEESSAVSRSVKLAHYIKRLTISYTLRKGWFHSNVVIDRWSHHLLLICHGWCSFSSLCCRSVFVCLLTVVGCVTAPVELGVPLLVPEEVSDAFVGFPGTCSWILQLILDRAGSHGQVLLHLIIIIVKLIVICICILGGCTWELMLSGLIDVCAAIFVALR